MPRNALAIALLSSLTAISAQAQSTTPPILWDPVVVPQERLPGGPVRPLASDPAPVTDRLYCPAHEAAVQPDKAPQKG